MARLGHSLVRPPNGVIELADQLSRQVLSHIVNDLRTVHGHLPASRTTTTELKKKTFEVLHLNVRSLVKDEKKRTI